mmetsp:Transcript_63124/g.174989  ORF Transcript_63124/g.174989 Transcript_63124/m.174989 type:complete len:207 (-) Transcript_63124:188-808(-)
MAGFSLDGEYAVQNGFITVRPSPCEAPKDRSKSAPPASHHACGLTLLAQDEEEKSESLRASCSRPLMQAGNATGNATRAASSLGSIGHPALCGRACEFRMKGPCRAGAACRRCHLCGADRKKVDKKMDKQARAMLRRREVPDERGRRDATPHQQEAHARQLQRHLRLGPLVRHVACQRDAAAGNHPRRLSGPAEPCRVPGVTARSS